MTVESFITRELGICFIDARHMVSAAKLQLGIVGYPTNQEKKTLRDQVLQEYNSLPEEDQAALKRKSSALDAMRTVSVSSRRDNHLQSSEEEEEEPSSSWSSDNLCD